MSTRARGAAAPLRLALLALAVACGFSLVLLAAYELAAARVPQHRAALEELIRHQTGLEVRFAALALRWGWYGPEALFQDVELGERRGAAPRLRVHRLIVSLDAWRMLRSGHLEARRITLESPAIDLDDAARALESPTRRGTSLQTRASGANLLARWRGGEIDITGGTLRTVLPGLDEVVTLGISHAQLRRLDRDWSAEAHLVLPHTLGATFHLALQMRARADLSEISGATVSVEGQHLELATWSALLGLGEQPQIPHSGTAEVQLRAALLQGRLQSASGRIAAESLTWRPAPSSAAAPSLERLRCNWQLRRQAGHWHLGLGALELESSSARRDLSARSPGAATAGESPGASVDVDFSADGLLARGRARHVPLSPLLSLVHAYVPPMLSAVILRGDARELGFDWNAYRAPGARLAASAELQDLAVTNESGNIELTGLSGQAVAKESSVRLALHAAAARLMRPDAAPLENLQIDTRLNAAAGPAGSWHLETRDLQVHGPGVNITASGALSLHPRSAPHIDVRLSVQDTDAALLTSALGSGRVQSGELRWCGELGLPPWSAAGEFAGALTLRDATVHERTNWPGVADLAAHLDWRGARFHAVIEHARTEGFALTDARADWDARAGHAAHFAGRLSGDAQQLTAWLRSHPETASWAPGLQQLDLRGHTLLDLELALPAAGAPRVRLAALLEGVHLHPVPGLPPLEGLHGTLAFAGGHLQRSTLIGRWLNGPASLSVAERREQGLDVLVVSGHGLVDAHAAVQAAAGNIDQAALDGSLDWSAMLSVVPGAGEAHWQLHADSSLAGIASHLPAPLDKPAGTPLPLHLDWETESEAARLRIALGERLAAVAALSRDGDTWRIARGAVRLGNGVPALPIEPAVLLDGQVNRLDLAAALALWRQAARDAALPRLRGRLSATELLAGARRFPGVAVTADSAGGAAALRFESADLSASAAWPARVDGDHPALLHVARFNLSQLDDAAVAMGLAAALAPVAELFVDELQWQGRDIGRLSGKIALRGASLQGSNLALSSAQAQARGTAQCFATDCKLNFSLDTTDAAATLAAFGLVPEVSARDSHLGGELRWPRGVSPSLATLGGHLHMHLEDGVMESAGDRRGERFPLLSVPALLSGVALGPGPASAAALRFERFSADYEVQGGEAWTSDLHFDGDAEILMRGRVGLVSEEYEQRAWILRGEDRLPAALRRLGPGPGVAALWLSLRDMFAGEAPERPRATLRLRGPWTDPIVTLE